MEYRVIVLVREDKGGETAHIRTFSAGNRGDAAVSALMEFTLKGVDIGRAKVHVTPKVSADVR